MIKKENENVGYGNFEIRARKNEDNETLIKRFLKKTKKERIIEEIVERKRFKKPTTKRREDLLKREMVLSKLRKQKELLDAKNDG